MPLFRVLHFEEGAGGESVEHRDVEAPTAQAAAERVCGVPLVEGGVPHRLRAQVNPEGRPAERILFDLRG